MPNENNGLIYSMSDGDMRAIARARTIVKECDAVLELVDARIARSTSNLLDYKNDPELKAIPRIVRFTFQDRADRKMLQEWIDEFRQQHCWVFESELSKTTNAESIIKDLYGKGVISLKTLANNDASRPIKIALLGVPNVGRSTFVQQCTNNFKQEKSVFNILPNLKNKVYELSDSLQVVDVPSILGTNFSNPEAYWNMQILNKIDTGEVEISGLALNAFLQIGLLQPELLLARYDLNVNKTSLTGKKANQYVLDAFHEIAIANNLKDEFDNFSVSSAFELFIKEVRNGRLGRLCLERVEK